MKVMNMSESVHRLVRGRFPDDLLMALRSRRCRPSLRAIISAPLAVLLAVEVVGAADNIDLPDELQFLVSHLDIATYIPIAVRFANPNWAFMLWVLPINTLFYASLLFAYLSRRDRRANVTLHLLPGGCVASTTPAPSTATGVLVRDGERQTIESISTDTSKEQMQGRAARAGVSLLSPVRPTSGPLTLEPLTEQLESQPATMAWKQLLFKRWEPVAIEKLGHRRRKSRPVFRLHGLHGETVIAKRCPKERARVERIIYQEFLPRVPLRTIRFRGVLEEPVGEFCWLFLEDAASEPYLPKLPHHRALAGRSLGEVHLASLSANLQGRLPGREPGYYLRWLRDSRAILVDHLAHNTAMVTDDTEVFRKVVAHLDVAETLWSEIEEICGVMPRTLVHGDFVAKNVRVRNGRGGLSLLVFDWGYAGWGVPGTDLAQLGKHVVNPDLGVYCSVMKRAEPHLSLAQIEAVAACGSLFRLVEEVRWARSYLKFGSRDYLIKPVETLREYEPLLAKALEILKGVLA